jgi:hypothetical protein
MAELVHKIFGRGIKSFNSWPGDPGDQTVVGMVWDSTTYKDAPCSITNPTMAAGVYAAAHFSAYCNGIDFDWKYTNGGNYDGGIGIYYYQGDINDPDTVFHYIVYTNYNADWTHEHRDLTPGVWSFVVGVLQDSSGAGQGWIDNIELSPSLILTGHQVGEIVTEVPCGTLSLTGYAPPFNGQANEIPCGSLNLTGSCPASGPTFADIPCGELTLTGVAPSYSWSLPPAPKPYGYDALAATPTPRPIYTLTLTGGSSGTGTPASHSLSGTAGILPNVPVVPGSLSINGFVLTSDSLLAPWYAYDDATGVIRGPGGVYLGSIDYVTGAWNVGLGAWVFGPTSASYQYVAAGTVAADVVIPMSSFTLRVRNGDPSYLNAIIPDSTSWQAAISARTTGDLILKKGYLYSDGTQVLEAIATVDFESVAIDRGDRSDSATLVGHRTTTYSSPATRTITGVSYYSLQADGRRRVRAPVDTFLRPGDTCVYGSGAGESFVVGEIEYIVDADLAYMEVSEEDEEE